MDTETIKKALNRREFIGLSLGAGVALALAACGGTAAPSSPAASQAAPGSTSPLASASSAPASTAPASSAPASAAPASASAKVSTPASAAPQYAKSIIFASNSIANTLDPQGTLSNSGFMMARQIFDALVTFDQAGKTIVPQLAASWKRIDNNTMEFALRDDVKFSNGEPFNADAVKFTVARMMNSNDPTHGATKSLMASLLPDVDVVNSTTVRLKTKNPDPILLNRLTSLFMLPPKYTASGADINSKPVGTGSFKVTDFKTVDHISLEAWDSWRGPSTVQTARIQQITEVAAFVSALKAGEVDIAWNVQGDLVSNLKNDFNVVAQPAYSCTISSLMPTIPAFANAKVRQAVNLAVNKEELIKQIAGGYGQLAEGQLLASNMPQFNSALKAFPYDPEKAKQLLKDAGFPSFSTQFMTTSSTKAIAEALAGYLQAVGINVKINLVELPVFVTNLTQKTDQQLIAWNTDYFSLRDYSQPALRFAVAKQPHFENAQFTQLYLNIEKELDETKRLDMIHQAEQIMYDQAGALFLSQRQFPIAFTKKISSLELPYDTTISLWKVKKAV